MHPLERYYLNQAGRVLPSTPGIGPVFTAPLYLQRGHGIDNFLGTVTYRATSPVECGPYRWQDIAKNNSPDVRSEDIISKHVGDAVTESTQPLISKLRGRCLKLVRRETKARGGKKPKSTVKACPGIKKG